MMRDDLIKRSDAIKSIEELPNAYNGWSDAYDKAYIIGTLEEVPSADRPSAVIETQTDCTNCDQVGRCERGRAVECPLTERR